MLTYVYVISNIFLLIFFVLKSPKLQYLTNEVNFILSSGAGPHFKHDPSHQTTINIFLLQSLCVLVFHPPFFPFILSFLIRSSGVCRANDDQLEAFPRPQPSSGFIVFHPSLFPSTRCSLNILFFLFYLYLRRPFAWISLGFYIHATVCANFSGED